MKKIFTYSLLLSLSLFPSCRKFGRGYERGTVLETGTNLPIQNALIDFAEASLKPNSYNGSAAQVYTDSEGKFSRSFQKKIGMSYNYLVSEKNHWAVYSASVKTKKDDQTIYLDPIAFVKVRLRSNNPLSATISGFSKNYFFDSNIQSQAPIDTIIDLRQMHGNIQTEIHIHVQYNDQNIPAIDKTSMIYVNKGDTLEYLVQLN